MSDLDRQDLLHRVSTALRVAGVVVMALGVMCLPAGFGVSPKRDLSAFANLADLGAFWKAGVMLLALGAVVLLTSLLLSGEDEHDPG